MIKLTKVVLLVVAMGLGTMVSSAQESTTNDVTKLLAKTIAIDFNGIIGETEKFSDGSISVLVVFPDVSSFKEMSTITTKFFNQYSDIEMSEPWSYIMENDIYVCSYYTAGLDYHTVLVVSKENPNILAMLTTKN